MSSERQAFNDGFDKGYAKAQDKIAQLEAEVERLRKHVKSAEEIIRKIPEEMFEDIIDEFYTALKARDD